MAVAAVARGASSICEIAERALGAVAELDSDICAFRVIDEELVRRSAQVLDDASFGSLRGLVVGVKDVIDTADLPTGYGSELFSTHQPIRDADAVAGLKAAGALILGKTQSTEFALFEPTLTRNPRNLSRTPGGSSSGSAAAVAAGMVPVALGTQTAGSVLRPAAYCGVYGFKPTRGWTSMKGIWHLADHLDTLGIFARSVDDLVLVHRVLRHPTDFTGRLSVAFPPPRRMTPKGQLSVGILQATEWAICEPEVGDALRYISSRLSDSGANVSDVDGMPIGWHELPALHQTVMAFEVAKNLHDALGLHIEHISESAKAVVEEGDRCPSRRYRAALEAKDTAVGALSELALRFDLLILPSARGVAPKGLGSTGDPVMCRAGTLLGVPTTNVPAYSRVDGLPVGIQVMAPHFDDLRYLDDLARFEALLDEMG